MNKKYIFYPSKREVGQLTLLFRQSDAISFDCKKYINGKI
jgi:hypothetical protein